MRLNKAIVPRRAMINQQLLERTSSTNLSETDEVKEEDLVQGFQKQKSGFSVLKKIKDGITSFKLTKAPEIEQTRSSSAKYAGSKKKQLIQKEDLLNFPMSFEEVRITYPDQTYELMYRPQCPISSEIFNYFKYTKKNFSKFSWKGCLKESVIESLEAAGWSIEISKVTETTIAR